MPDQVRHDGFGTFYEIVNTGLMGRKWGGKMRGRRPRPLRLRSVPPEPELEARGDGSAALEAEGRGQRTEGE